MGLKYLMARAFCPVYDNNLDAFVPQLWAQESLAILEENLVAGALCYRDFEAVIANYGDVVNTRRPGEFKAVRKVPADNVTVQDATATNIQVPLNQHIHVSFLIKDGEESTSFKDLVTEYMAPAMLAQARILDQIVLGQVYQFLPYSYGGLNQLSATNAKDAILGARKVMNQNKAYMGNRNLVLTPNSETALLNLDLFNAAYAVGDDGTALREASLGRKLGFDMFMAQNTPSTSSAGSGSIVADTLSAAATKGSLTVVLTTGTAAEIVAGNWLTIAGDNTPLMIQAYNSGTKVVTFTSPLKQNVPSSAAVTLMKQATVNLVAGYPVNWAKPINYSAAWGDIQAGQGVTFTTDVTKIYTVIQVDTVAKTILLDRPLDNAIANGNTINVTPTGDYNFAFHRNAIALVVRPLAQPRPGTGALSSVVNFNDLSMRATITYNGLQQGHLVTLDMLCGIAILDQHLGAVMLG